MSNHFDDHPDFGLARPSYGRHREVLAYGNSPVPILRKDLPSAEDVVGRRQVFQLLVPPCKARAAVVPLSEGDLAASVQGNNVKQPDITRDASSDTAHLVEKVRSETLDGRLKLAGGLQYVLPVEFALFSKNVAINGQLAKDLISQECAMLQANLRPELGHELTIVATIEDARLTSYDVPHKSTRGIMRGILLYAVPSLDFVEDWGRVLRELSPLYQKAIVSA